MYVCEKVSDRIYLIYWNGDLNHVIMCLKTWNRSKENTKVKLKDSLFSLYTFEICNFEDKD